MKTTYKVQCTCKHEHQDKLHGQNVRLANRTKKPAPQGQVNVRCTVCSKEHIVRE